MPLCGSTGSSRRSRIHPKETIKALSARDVMEDHDTGAGTVVLYAFADCGDDAGGFVSEDAGCGMGTGGNLLEVGAADAAGVDADEHFSSTDLGNGQGLHADV